AADRRRRQPPGEHAGQLPPAREPPARRAGGRSPPLRCAVALGDRRLPGGTGRRPGRARKMKPAGAGRGGAVVRVSIVGLGAIGCEVLKAVQARPDLLLASVADPALAGRDAGEAAGVDACGVTVVAGVAEAFARDVDVALVLTGSSVADVEPIIELAAARRVDVISTCEDLAYADLSTPELARRIDARAREGGITVVGTGVNP